MSAYDDGLEVRCEVMGEAHVNRARSAADPLTMPLQQLVTEFAWGRVWTRDQLTRSTRSLITIAMLVAGRHHDELRGHVRGAINNGCAPEELAEVVIHASVYCGFPAALSAMRIVRSTLDELGTETSDERPTADRV